MSALAANQHLFPIGYVARATGLTTHVIRAWEKRYDVVRPARTAKNRRLYSRDDIDRLNLLRRAVSGGHTISQLAALSHEGLLQMLREPNGSAGVQLEATEDRAVNRLSVACLRAVWDLDQPELERALLQASVKMSRMALFDRLIAPLLEEIGRLWSIGSLKIVHEHMASAVIQGVLWDMLRSARTEGDAPGMVVATPAGQHCQMGALIGSVMAADAGWQPHYCGANLPAEELAAAVDRKKARALALSIAYQSDDSAMTREFMNLKTILPPGVHLFVGGRAWKTYRELIETAGGKCFDSLAEFTTTLADIGPRKAL